LGAFAVSCLLASVILSSTQARQSPRKPAEKRGAKASTPAEPENPAQIELLETRYRFETSGDSRKEVHTRVKINSELGVRQFARITEGCHHRRRKIEGRNQLCACFFPDLDRVPGGTLSLLKTLSCMLGE